MERREGQGVERGEVGGRGKVGGRGRGKVGERGMYGGVEGWNACMARIDGSEESGIGGRGGGSTAVIRITLHCSNLPNCTCS